mmetsp:Transcript_105321/g.187210  ORF Transcript_105321/g.187210 Transcript_105321/m.187210 type:complete len:402 (-) Transcript_105321:26-1231(-)
MLLVRLVLLLALVAGELGPVVIIPGDGSNQLEAKLNKPSTVSWLCSKKSDWFRLWLDTAMLIADTKCWADNIRLIYDEQNDKLSNNFGVETRVPGWGETSSFEELDPGLPGHASGVFLKMVEALVKAGLERGKTLRGAPYDFRYAPPSAQGAEFIVKLRQLIEDTATATGRRVSLISHSMGCLQTQYLLKNQSQEWKDKFVERWIPISGPWAGAVKELRLHASGDNQGVPLVSSLSIREEQRSYETNFWLMPMPRWFGNQTLVSTNSRNYSAQDYDAFFEDIEYKAGKQLFRRVADLTSDAEAPGVEVLCLYSLGVDTPVSLSYGSKGFDKQPDVVNGDGDGTVNDLSLKLCDRWKGPRASAERFANVTHAGMISNDAVIQRILEVLAKGAAPLNSFELLV